MLACSEMTRGKKHEKKNQGRVCLIISFCHFLWPKFVDFYNFSKMNEFRCPVIHKHSRTKKATFFVILTVKKKKKKGKKVFRLKTGQIYLNYLFYFSLLISNWYFKIKTKRWKFLVTWTMQVRLWRELLFLNVINNSEEWINSRGRNDEGEDKRAKWAGVLQLLGSSYRDNKCLHRSRYTVSTKPLIWSTMVKLKLLFHYNTEEVNSN